MNKSKVISVILSLCLIFTFVSSFSYATHVNTSNNTEVEPNNTGDDSNYLQLVNGQAIVNGTLTGSSDVDYFEYTPEKNSDITFTFIANSNGSYFYAIWDMYTGELKIQRSTATSVQEGTFGINARHRCLIAIAPVSGSNLQYQISFICSDADRQVTLDGLEEMESNNSPSTANILPTIYNLYGGYVENSNDCDYYTFTATEDMNTQFSFYPQCNANFYLMLYDIDNEQYIWNGYITTPGQFEEIPFTLVNGNSYRIGISATGTVTNARYYFQLFHY